MLIFINYIIFTITNPVYTSRNRFNIVFFFINLLNEKIIILKITENKFFN